MESLHSYSFSPLFHQPKIVSPIGIQINAAVIFDTIKYEYMQWKAADDKSIH